MVSSKKNTQIDLMYVQPNQHLVVTDQAFLAP
jgi:hypothetical protein